ncbi:aspartate aminotransferase [candidate division KSB1 bacterium]|nr:MAG: aspartate aminotransferase [candidate division KSB1 bacterium]
MEIEIFNLERTQSLWENTVEYNLTETGIHPFTIEELLNKNEIEKLLSLRLGYCQTNGSIELREKIAAMYPGSDRDNILVTNGSIEANFLSVWSLLDEGDELVLMLPNYMQIWGVARAFKINVKPFYLKEDLNWHPDIEELKKLITPKTKMIAVCNPNNPTGAVLSEKEMDEIVSMAEDAGAWLYADEIYRGAELSGKDTPSFYGKYEKAIVAGGLSKAYSLPGLRIGWLAGPEKFISDAWARKDYTTIAPCILSDRIAARTLVPETRAKILDRNRKILRENLSLVTEWADSHKGLFRFIPPEAGGMVFMSYDFDINSTELSNQIRREKSTFIVAGDCFGMDHRIRLGIGSEKIYLQEALKRISEFLRDVV